MTENSEFFTDAGLWRDILFADAYSLKGKTSAEKQATRDVWLRDFLYSDYRLPQQRETGAVFFRSLVRDDYKGLFHAVIGASGIRDRVVVEEYQHRTPRLNAAASRYMMENAAVFDALDIADPLDRACCFIRACKYGFILEHFRKMTFKALICFADMQPVEHLLARYFRAQGVTTLTLQHGLYVDYGDMDTVNVINYQHQPSEYFLSWGPESSQLIKHHHPGNTTVNCGKPLIFNASGDEVSEKPQPYIAVFLDQRIFNQQNEEMLQIASACARRTGRTVKVRFHPSIRKEEFLQRFPDIREQLHFQDADFVIGHTSSLIYEALSLGCRVLRYDSEVPGIPLPDSCTFRTLEQLEARLALPQPEGLAQQYFCATGEASLRRYADFFREVLPDLAGQAAA
ncbi:MULTISPECIES: hypothetical protein [unclassified Leisingera]|uniref:hypothetical protein n=1 Tax=unclassified Leisingera TaxID=2614906 RepID=UPI0010130CA1|nr:MULTISPECIES: hypothetical protein [unclassified Leisingera]MCF6430583.1 hypothetical protein [Leisingera sp. MMG026]QAX32103.1 hypothetical protein ETW24_22205 [Leisingera sp. NJS204]